MKSTIHRAFLSASLICSACASKGAPAGGDDDIGDDGGGSGDPTGTLTFDDTGFFVDAPVRWSANPMPTATGTISDDSATLEVVVANHTIAEASIAAGTWTVTLPASSVGVIPTDVSFVAKKNGHDLASLTRKIAVDVTPPVLAAMPSVVQNELNDVIALGPAGEITSHTHVDTNATTLGGAGCPDVFKHGYLMDPGDSNPIHWKLVASDDGVGIDPSSATVRVGRADTMQFGPARPVTGAVTAGTITYDLDVLRSGPSGDAFVATTEGKLLIQLTAKDRLNREVTFERCWTQHPLAVPLLATPAIKSTGPVSLTSMDLQFGPFHNLAQGMINPGSLGLALMEYDLFNSTSEATVVTLNVDRPELRTRRDYVKQTAVESVSTTKVSCTPADESRCTSVAGPARSGNTGTVQTESPSRFVVRVFAINATGGFGTEVPCSVCDAVNGLWAFALPGKANANAPSAHFRVMTAVREIRNWFPSGGGANDPDPGPFVDSTIAGVPFTGRFLSTFDGCTKPVFNADGDAFRCDETTTFQEYRALSHVELVVFGTLVNHVATAPTAQITPRSIASLATPRSFQQFQFISTVTLPPPAF